MMSPPSRGSWIFFLAVLAAMAVSRMVELRVSRRRATKAAAQGRCIQPEPGFAAMVALHTIPFWMGPLEVLILGRPFIPWLVSVSTCALIVAAALRVWTLRSLGEMWNVRLVLPSTVVTSGPYAFVRHPNYAIVAIELLFLPLVHSAFLTSALVTIGNALVLTRRIRIEEALLATIPGYRNSMGAKPRFIPSPRQPR